MQWVSEKIAERGGDPARIFLMGQSAGAIHVAGYVSHPEFHKVKGGGLAGAVMVSGLYDLTASPAGDAEIAYFGSDPSRYAERSSLQGLLATKIPLMVTAAELDPPRFVEQFELIKQASCKRAERMRARLHAAAAQPHLGSLCDQHRGYAADGRDSGVREEREIAAASFFAADTVSSTRKYGPTAAGCPSANVSSVTEGVADPPEADQAGAERAGSGGIPPRSRSI